MGKRTSRWLIVVLVLAWPSALFAQERQSLKMPTAAFLAAASADWATTYHGLKHYRLRETNPMLRRLGGKPAKLALIGGAIDVGAVALWNSTVGKKSPKLAAATLWLATAFRAYLVVNNIRNMQRADRR